jgi:hypothetical protein
MTLSWLSTNNYLQILRPVLHLFEQQSALTSHESPLGAQVALQTGSVLQSESKQSVPPLQSLSNPSLQSPSSEPGGVPQSAVHEH